MLPFSPLDVLVEIWDLIVSVSEVFSTYFWLNQGVGQENVFLKVLKPRLSRKLFLKKKQMSPSFHPPPFSYKNRVKLWAFIL